MTPSALTSSATTDASTRCTRSSAVAADAGTGCSASTSDAEAAQLWELACVLATHDMTPQAITTLEAVCAASTTNSSAHAQQIVLCAHVLLAEICLVTVPSATSKRMDRKLWRKRLARAEQCARTVDQALVEQSTALPLEWRCRLLKVQCLLLEAAKTESAAKSQQLLELLCTATRVCTESSDQSSAPESFQPFFLAKLRAHLAALHSASLLAEHIESAEPLHAQFLQSVLFVQQSVPVGCDGAFQLWLVELVCHAYATSVYFDSGHDVRERIHAATRCFSSLSTHTATSRELQVHHLVLTSFYYLRSGELKKIAPVVDEVRALISARDTTPTGVLQEPYLENVLDSLHLYALACSDPCEALAISTPAIRRLQTNILAYASTASVHVMLTATLFDMLYVHCRLQAQQCRYFELGLSIAQMLQLFATHKAVLEPTVLYKFFVARCHVLIAKYAAALGKVKETVVNINYVVEKLLPPITSTTTAYSDAHLSVWTDALDVLTSCSSAADASVTTAASDSASAPQIHQLYPNAVLLEFGARLLEMDALRALVYASGSVELRAKYNLALAKWLSGSRELAARSRSESSSSSSSVDLAPHPALERLRPTLRQLLHDALERTGDAMGCSETLGELMALLGRELLVHRDTTAEGEETLKNALRISLHAKNVLLQTRVLAAIFQLYCAKRDVPAQATTAEKCEKKARVLHKRVAQAQAETARNKLVMRWRGGE